MELPSLDLNPVVVLHALLEERNVTRAGERVGLSQPGTSSALARLRRHFDDPLLERVGTVYELTPLAQALRSELGSTMEQLQRVLAAQPRFDPATTERRFTVACSDAVLTVLGPGLVAAVSRAAPHVSLDLRSLDARVATDPLAVLRDLDVLVVPRGLFSLPDVPSVELYRDRWVCATWRGNTTVGQRLSLADVGRARWVMPFQELLMASPADAALATLGVDRHCAVRVESFSVLDRLVVGTELLVLFHERLAGELTAHDLRVVELPVALPPIIETAWSHPSRQLDPGHRWLLDVLTEVSATLDQPTTSPSR